MDEEEEDVGSCRSSEQVQISTKALVVWDVIQLVSYSSDTYLNEVHSATAMVALDTLRRNGTTISAEDFFVFWMRRAICSPAARTSLVFGFFLLVRFQV